jgi:HD-GYP domain-containing protein (c-di-GMP phosphodiesterase class II)
MAKVRNEKPAGSPEEPENNGGSFEHLAGQEVPVPDLGVERVASNIQVQEAEPVSDLEAQKISEIRQRLGVEEAPAPTTVLGEIVRIVVPEGDEKAAKFLEERWEQKVAPKTREELGEIWRLVAKERELLIEIQGNHRIFDKTVEATSGMIDAISPWTADHSLRLTLATDKIIKEFWGESPEFRKTAFQAGLLHDVGKSGLEKIINKAGMLNEEERALMNKHASLGYDLLAPALGPEIAAGTFHHEKWNGQGYTEGLLGHETPVVSRLLEVSDIMDALLSFRPYKQGKTPEASIAIIETETGSYIDVDRDTKEIKIKGADLDPIVTSQLTEMYEGRQLRFKDYFRPEELEAQVKKELAESDVFTKASVEAKMRENEFRLESLMWGDDHGPNGAGFDVYDFEHSLKSFDRKKAARFKKELSVEIEKLEVVADKLREIDTNAFFLWVNGVEAKSQAGDTDEQLKKARQRTENRIYFALMLAQQAGLTKAEQKQVVLASVFATSGMLSVPESKFASTEEIGIKDFADFENVPKVGYELLQYLTNDPEIAHQFEGADIGARDLYKWYNGQGGYGVGDPKPSKIGHIVSIAHKYVAMRSTNPHRNFDLGMAAAMAEMRKGVGTEFDPELFVYWEQLYAEDQLRGYIRRPQMVDIVRRAAEGRPELVAPNDDISLHLAALAGMLAEAKSLEDKLELALKGAEFAKEHSQHHRMERFVDIGQEIALQLGDRQAIDKMIGFYDYDLEPYLADAQKEIADKLAKKNIGGVIGAKGVLVNLIQDFAEKQQSLPDGILIENRDRILAEYRLRAEDLLNGYRVAVEKNDVEALKKLREQVDRAAKDLGDKDFAERAKMAEKEGLSSRVIGTIDNHLAELNEMMSANMLADPWGAEHLLASAKRELRINQELIAEDTQRLINKRLKSLEAQMRQKGYMAIFRKFREAAHKGEAKLTEELALEVYRWTKDLPQGIDVIGEDRMTELLTSARRKGIQRNIDFLKADDLGLEDIPLIKRWQNNILDWQGKLEVGEEMIEQADVSALSHNAYLRVMNALPEELKSWTEGASEVELKRLLITLKEYVGKNRDNNFPAEYKDQVDGHISQVGGMVYTTFLERAKSLVAQGKEYELAEQVGFFEKFCLEKNKFGEELRIALTQAQEDELHLLQVRGYSKSVDIHLENIGKAGHAKLERFRAEVKGLQQIWEKLVDVEPQSLQMREGYQGRLNGAIEQNFSAAIARSIQDGDTLALASTIRNLYDLRSEKWVEEEEVEKEGEKLNKLVPPLVIEPNVLIPRELKDFAGLALLEGGINAIDEAGDVSTYMVARRAAELLANGQLSDEWNAVNFEKALERSEAKIRLLGTKFHIVEMRKELDLVLEFADKVGGVNRELLDRVITSTNEMAKLTVQTYRVMLERNKFAGSLMSIPHSKNIEWVEKLIERLIGDTKSGKEDASYLKYALASVV